MKYPHVHYHVSCLQFRFGGKSPAALLCSSHTWPDLLHCFDLVTFLFFPPIPQSLSSVPNTNLGFPNTNPSFSGSSLSLSTLKSVPVPRASQMGECSYTPPGEAHSLPACASTPVRKEDQVASFGVLVYLYSWLCCTI